MCAGLSGLQDGAVRVLADQSGRRHLRPPDHVTVRLLDRHGLLPAAVLHLPAHQAVQPDADGQPAPAHQRALGSLLCDSPSAMFRRDTLPDPSSEAPFVHRASNNHDQCRQHVDSVLFWLPSRTLLYGCTVNCASNVLDACRRRGWMGSRSRSSRCAWCSSSTSATAAVPPTSSHVRPVPLPAAPL